jgi:type IV secretory pathway VirB10-like protein
MRMPSLFRYFVVVGGVLTGLLLLVNSWLEPVAPPAAATAAMANITVQHDPRASIIERLRNEQAAREAARIAAERARPLPEVAVVPEPAAPVSQTSPTRPEPPQIVAPVALTTPAAEPDAQADTRAAEQLRAAQARKARIARERARARRQQEDAARDPFHYGNPRSAFASEPGFAPWPGRTW